MNQSNELHSDEAIDLVVVFKTLWAKKIIILLISIALGSASYFFVKSFIPKQYTAVGVFAFKSGRSSQFGGLSSLASLAGLPNSDRKSLVPQITGRVFLEPFFLKNQLHTLPDLKDGVDGDSDIVAFEKAFLDFRLKHLSITESDDGSLNVSITLEDSKKVAEIVNNLMNDFITYKKDEIARKSLEQLRYYSGELARIQEDVDQATTNVEEFALKANILSEDDFTNQSILLENLRERLTEINAELLELEKLQMFLSNGQDFDQFKTQAIQTRRFHAKLATLPSTAIFGDWRSKVDMMLKDETQALQKQQASLLNALQVALKNTEETAKEAGVFRKLKQHAQIEAVTLEVFTEQFKKEQVIGGFNDKPGVVYEYAVAPIKPSGPRKLLTLLVTLLTSVFALSGYFLIKDYQRPVLWSINTIKDLFISDNIYKLDKDKLTNLIARLLVEADKKNNVQLFLALDDNLFVEHIIPLYREALRSLDKKIILIDYTTSEFISAKFKENLYSSNVTLISPLNQNLNDYDFFVKEAADKLNIQNNDTELVVMFTDRYSRYRLIKTFLKRDVLQIFFVKEGISLKQNIIDTVSQKLELNILTYG